MSEAKQWKNYQEIMNDIAKERVSAANERGWENHVSDTVQAVRIRDLEAQRDDLMRATKALLDCPVIAERDIEPAFACQETEEAVALAAGILLETHRAKVRGD